MKVTLVMGSTGNLAQQVAVGAPADVFFAANEAFVDNLIERGALLRETRALYAQGRIGIAARPGRGLKELRALTNPAIRRIAIANPSHAPYGKAAEEALRSAGLWEAVKPRLVYGDNVRHTLQFLETGAVDVAIIALSIAEVPGIEFTLIDAACRCRSRSWRPSSPRRWGCRWRGRSPGGTGWAASCSGGGLRHLTRARPSHPQGRCGTRPGAAPQPHARRGGRGDGSRALAHPPDAPRRARRPRPGRRGPGGGAEPARVRTAGDRPRAPVAALGPAGRRARAGRPRGRPTIALGTACRDHGAGPQ